MSTNRQRTRASPDTTGKLMNNGLPQAAIRITQKGMNMTQLKYGHFKYGNLVATLCFAGFVQPALAAYDSGSTGADGPFNPTVNTELQIPASGVFNFTTVNIPTGVTVTFKKNTTNTPVVILASGNVSVAGSINVSGNNAAHAGAGGDGNIGDDGVPGTGGPGGYEGGRGGSNGADKRGGIGLGPGGGLFGGKGTWPYGDTRIGGGGGGFGSVGSNSAWGGSESYQSKTGLGGSVYSSSQLLPLIGGSGGGGGAGGNSFTGSGGGGGGGALLIASSGTVTVTGVIQSNGGLAGSSLGSGAGAEGGSGSGGAIRIVATSIAGNGTIQALGGNQTINSSQDAGGYVTDNGGAGGVGRIRLEAETFTRTAASNPAHSFGSPSSAFVAGLPTLRITSVAGTAAPTNPTGTADITLPSTTPNPVTVEFATTGVPTGNTVSLRISPAYGDAVTVISPAITGTTAAGTASVSATLPTGPSVLSATTTYTIVVAMGEALSIYAQGETVEKVRLSTTMNGPTLATLITKSGKEFEVPHAALAMIGS